MGITAAQADPEARKKRIWSSETPAVCNVSPYANSADVCLMKSPGYVAPPPNDAMEAGTLCEDAVLDWSEPKIGKGRRNILRVCKDIPLGAHLDRDLGKPAIVQAKTAGICGPLCGDWGDPGTDHVPISVSVQCQSDLMCAGKDYEVCWVPVLIGGRGFSLYRVEADQEIQDLIAEAVVHLWENHIVPGVPPPGGVASIDILKRLGREPESSVVIDGEPVKFWQADRTYRLSIKKGEAGHHDRIVASLGDAERGTFPGGCVTYLQQNSARQFDVDAMLRDRVLEKYLQPQAHHRVLRFVKDKGD